VELTAEGVVEGEVVDARGNPVAGARVAKDHVPTWLAAGVHADGFAMTDSHGHFTLGELPEGAVSIEAYSPESGRGRAEGVKVVSGRTTSRIRVELAAPETAAHDPSASGSVAVTLGETGAPVEVQIASVVEGSEAERGGLAPGDTVVAVDGVAVTSMQDARTRMSGPIADDVVVQVRRGGELRMLRVAREAVRH
jgi:S1-C subfamily serine protease